MQTITDLQSVITLFSIIHPFNKIKLDLGVNTGVVLFIFYPDLLRRTQLFISLGVRGSPSLRLNTENKGKRRTLVQNCTVFPASGAIRSTNDSTPPSLVVTSQSSPTLGVSSWGCPLLTYLHWGLRHTTRNQVPTPDPTCMRPVPKGSGRLPSKDVPVLVLSP